MFDLQEGQEECASLSRSLPVHTYTFKNKKRNVAMYAYEKTIYVKYKEHMYEYEVNITINLPFQEICSPPFYTDIGDGLWHWVSEFPRTATAPGCGDLLDLAAVRPQPLIMFSARLI